MQQRTTLMYGTPNLSSKHSVVPVNTVQPRCKRAPRENPSTYALESAMTSWLTPLIWTPSPCVSPTERTRTLTASCHGQRVNCAKPMLPELKPSDGQSAMLYHVRCGKAVN